MTTEWIIAGAALGALAVSIYNVIGIRNVHVLVNSRLTELLAVTRASAKAEGVKQEKDRIKEQP